MYAEPIMSSPHQHQHHRGFVQHNPYALSYAALAGSEDQLQQQHYMRNDDHQQHYRDPNAAQQPDWTASYSAYSATPAVCLVCRSQHVPHPGAACSRRCGWVANCSCPQCGRYRPDAPTVFCSSGCASEARQANWCVGCGVRQIPHGSTSCGAPACVAVVQRLAMRLASAGNHPRPAAGRGRTGSTASSGSSPAAANGAASASSAAAMAVRGKRRFEPHAVLSPNDKVAGAVRQQLGPELCRRVAAVIKVGGPSDVRKQYTAYRCRVEGEMNDVCGIGAPKFGHGGEGNEHRRYLSLRSDCGAELVSASEVRTCGSSTCQVCQFLDAGVSTAMASSECVSAFSTAISAATASDSSCAAMRAVAVCRVTVGNPTVYRQNELKGKVPAPATLDKVHSTVVQHDGFDIAHVPTSAGAIDALYVVLLRREA